jgi:hypothetical protein
LDRRRPTPQWQALPSLDPLVGQLLLCETHPAGLEARILRKVIAPKLDFSQHRPF